MKILPKRNIVLITKMGKEEIERKISENSEYRGHANTESFEICRIINYRNSFLPQIKGNIYDDYNATRVEVSMKLNTLVLIFMPIWFVGVLSFCGMVISNFSFSDFDIFYLIPFVMLILGALFMYVPFSIECRRSERDLQRILDAEIIQKH